MAIRPDEGGMFANGAGEVTPGGQFALGENPLLGVSMDYPILLGRPFG